MTRPFTHRAVVLAAATAVAVAVAGVAVRPLLLTHHRTRTGPAEAATASASSPVVSPPTPAAGVESAPKPAIDAAIAGASAALACPDPDLTPDLTPGPAADALTGTVSDTTTVTTASPGLGSPATGSAGGSLSVGWCGALTVTRSEGRCPGGGQCEVQLVGTLLMPVIPAVPAAPPGPESVVVALTVTVVATAGRWQVTGMRS